MSAFDRAGLSITFGGGQGVIRKTDGTVILTSHLKRGMYVVDAQQKTVKDAHTIRELHGFTKPVGFATGFSGVQVGVQNSVPQKNPYPWHGYVGWCRVDGR